MNILTFDTALNKTYISLSDDNNEIENVIIENHDDKYHSAFLIQEIADILKKNQFKMEDINAVGINVGPGSFTGIRACTTVGRIIAQQLNLPLVPTSSLHILSKISKEKSLVTLDARKNCAYIGLYENSHEIEPPTIVKREELIDIAKKSKVVISDGAMAEFLNNNAIKAINYEQQNYLLNKYLMEITFEKLNSAENKNDEYNWAKVKPLYIQPPSVFGVTLKTT